MMTPEQIAASNGVFDKALALISDLEDGEIVGLEPQGAGKAPFLRHWNAVLRISAHRGQHFRLLEYGIHNLHAHELSRVGVSQPQYEEACLAEN